MILNKIMQTKITIDEIFFIMIHTSPIFLDINFSDTLSYMAVYYQVFYIVADSTFNHISKSDDESST